MRSLIKHLFIAGRTVGLVFGLLLTSVGAMAQTSAAPSDQSAAETPAPKRSLEAVRLTQAIRLDGDLNEAEWQRAPVTSDFVETRPHPGLPERHKTEVRILYDDAALYVGAIMHDVAPDSILRELAKRDNFATSDFFGVFIDPYRDGLNGYGFFVTPSGVQMDARYSNGGDNDGEDFSWNAVWDARAALRGTDWVVEMRLPYSAIRFAAAPEQTWGVNFMRQRKSTNQGLFWNQVKPKVNGFVNQWGLLTGLHDLRPPLRLALTPYVSGYVNHYPYNQIGVKNTNTTFNGGMDVQLGLSDAFTLNSTLVPDFGQVQSDNVVLNLSPFEVRYNENRPFFLEGTELFNKGNFFYSRRVGATPLGFYDVENRLQSGERLLKNPGESRLYNATKISGRTKSNLGVGVFNAVTRPIYAEAEGDEGRHRKLLTQPLTNYNIVVLDQALPHNSYVSFVNTNTMRQGSTYDANLAGGLFRLANKTNSYALTGKGSWSHRRGRQFGSEAKIDDPNGYSYYLEAGKVSGTWTGNVYHETLSDHYNPNDLGLLFANNSHTDGFNLNYNHPDPIWRVNNFNLWSGGYLSRLYQPGLFQELSFYAGGNTTFTKSFTTIGFNLNLTPVERRDYFEPRTEPLGRYWLPVPASGLVEGWISTDYRKKLALDVNWGYRRFWNAPHPRQSIDLTIMPRYRFSNQLSLRHTLEIYERQNMEGYPGGFDSSTSDSAYVGQVLMGRRRQHTVINTTQLTYIFTNRMSLSFRARHYFSAAVYRDFFQLKEGGVREQTDYARNRDVTFNAFNIDAVFSWWFAPGSEMSLVWKDAIYTSDQADQITVPYFSNLQSTLNAPQNNSVSVKILYYLDYLSLLRRRG